MTPAIQVGVVIATCLTTRWWVKRTNRTAYRNGYLQGIRVGASVSLFTDLMAAQDRARAAREARNN